MPQSRIDRQDGKGAYFNSYQLSGPTSLLAMSLQILAEPLYGLSFWFVVTCTAVV